MLLRCLVPGVVCSEVPDFGLSSALPAIGGRQFPDHLITHLSTGTRPLAMGYSLALDEFAGIREDTPRTILVVDFHLPDKRT